MQNEKHVLQKIRALNKNNVDGTGSQSNVDFMQCFYYAMTSLSFVKHAK